MRYGITTGTESPTFVTDDPETISPVLGFLRLYERPGNPVIYGAPCICGGTVDEWIEVDENLDPVDFSTAFCSDECYREAMAERDAEVWGERP